MKLENISEGTLLPDASNVKEKVHAILGVEAPQMPAVKTAAFLPHLLPDTPLGRRFSQFIMPEPFSGCWLWCGSWMSEGYGNFALDGKSVLAHRLAYVLCGGCIPPGLYLDHLCRTHCCVNPRHLEPVTQKENVRRGRGPSVSRARRALNTHCCHGHPFKAESIYWRPDGRRECRVCRRNVRLGTEVAL